MIEIRDKDYENKEEAFGSLTIEPELASLYIFISRGSPFCQQKSRNQKRMPGCNIEDKRQKTSRSFPNHFAKSSYDQ